MTYYKVDSSEDLEASDSTHNFESKNDASEEIWQSRLVDKFGDTYGRRYATAFAHHLIPHDSPEPLSDFHFHELKIPIGHRKRIVDMIDRVCSATNSMTELPVGKPEGLERTMSMIRMKKNPTAPLQMVLPSFSSEKSGMTCTRLVLQGGLEWIDYEGVAETYEKFLDSVGEIIFSRGTPHEVPSHFIRAFWDISPMSYFASSHTKSGEVCAILLLRLPALNVKGSTVATMTNRFVFLYIPHSHQQGKLITFHKDSTVAIPWLHDLKDEWNEVAQLSRERFFMHLLSEALMTSGKVLERYRMQLECFIEIQVSFNAAGVVEWMSLINRQAQVLKRCLCANKVAIEGLTGTFQMDAQTTLQELRGLAATAEEIEGNAMYAMNLRMGLVGFKEFQNMKFFTFVSAVTAPLAVATGWYGMNFKVFPEISEVNAYWVFIGAMTALVVSMILTIRYQHIDGDETSMRNLVKIIQASMKTTTPLRKQNSSDAIKRNMNQRRKSPGGQPSDMSQATDSPAPLLKPNINILMESL